MKEKWFEDIAARFGLGRVIEPARPLSGGLMHQMFALTTERGKYAVKLLNPHVMARPEAPGNFRRCEELEARMEEKGLPIVAARRLNGRKMQKAEGQYFYVFDFYEGRALTPGEIQPAHCAAIGTLLARIHGLDRRESGFEPEEMSIDWRGYRAELAGVDAEAGALLAAALGLLEEIEARRNRAIFRLPRHTALSHGDMDRKNVLWKGDELRLIDLECLNYAQPQLELMELALCWSGLEKGEFDEKSLTALVDAYVRGGGEAPQDWETLLDANWDRLYWLKYNVERALGRGAGPEERALGLSQMRVTLNQTRLIMENRARLLDALKRGI